MPQLAVAAATWAVSAFTSAAAAINTAALAISSAALPGLSFAAQIAVANAATNAIVYGGLALAAAGTASLMRPDTPSSGTTLDFKPDPKAPIRGAMGFAAIGGNKVFQNTWGYKKVAMSLGVALSLGPVDAITQFRADDSVVTFAGPQNEATGFYAADMWQTTTLGLPTDAALLPPSGLKYGTPGLTGWGTQYAAPQVSFAFWTMVLAKKPEDRNIFTNGVPDPRWIGRWMKLWDPRKDSTYPGGSGPQRRDDWRTWEWTESPYVHALAWLRGHYKLNADGTVDRNKRIAGLGVPDEAIDMPAYVEAMNVAQANAWVISGEWSTSDSKYQTYLAMLQAGGGEPISRGAKISVLVNAPRVSTYTYTSEDLIGQADIRTLTPRRERKNTIIPRYKSEAHGWEYVPAGEVTSQVYRDEDRGEPRTIEVQYTHVRIAKQAGQLAAYNLANLREGLTATLPSKPYLMGYGAGDCITINVPEIGLVGQKVIIRRCNKNHMASTITFEVRSETDGKHPWALGQAANPPPSPAMSAVDPTYMPPPAIIDWTVAPRPPVPGGPSQPVIDINGKIETGDVASVIIEHGPTADGPWTLVYSGAPSIDGRYEAKSLQPGSQYWISIRVVAKNGTVSDRLVDGPHTAGNLIAGDVIPTAPVIVGLQDQITTAFGDIFDVSNVVAEARNDLDAVEAEIAAARGGEGSLSARVAAVNQARIDGDTANASAISGVAARTSATEADIIDLENAQVGESLARAEQVNQLSARIAGAGTAGAVSPDATGSQFTPSMLGQPAQAAGWGSATYPLTQTVTVNGANVLRTTSAGTADINYTVLRPIFTLVQGRVYELRTDYTLAGTATNFEHIRAILRPVTALGAGTSDGLVSAGSQAGLGRRTLVQRFSAGVATAGAVTVPATVSHVRAGIRGPMTAGQTSASVAGYILDVHSMEWVDVTDEVALSASVTEHTLAIIDLENNLAGAGFRKIAEAAGGAPAYYEFFSSNTGGYAAIAAPVVALVNTSVGGDPVVAMELVDGKARFYGDLSVQSGTSGERTVITTNAFRVYDAANVDRVTLGRW